MGGVPYKKRLMVTKSIRISEELLKRVEAQLWNEALESIPHGRQVEFYARAVVKELERLEGKKVDIAIDELSELYDEIGKCTRMSGSDLACVYETISILKEYKSIKEEESATI